MTSHTLKIAAVLASLAMLSFACSDDGDSTPKQTDDNETVDNAGKGDLPGIAGFDACEQRQDDVLETGLERFVEDFVRWPCGDVEGVTSGPNGDDRGQEYCEYFSIIRLPDEAGIEQQETGDVFGIPNQSPLGPDLNIDQEFWLEDNANEVVGECVFTSWHRDIPGPVPACADQASCPEVLGNPITEETFRMKIGFNSNGAASDLVQKCVDRVNRDEYGEAKRIENEFVRGCMLVADIFGTEWRSSDPQICAASMRLGECGCTLAGDPDADLGFALVPPLDAQMERAGGIIFRGFPLGTWSGLGELPIGCEYKDIGLETNGEPSRTIVTCPITGQELLTNKADPKGFCRDKYGDDVVLHVPVPKGAIECNPPEEGIFSHTCSEMPWVVTAEGEPTAEAECCKICTIGTACGDTCISSEENCTVEPGCACQAE